MPVDISNKNNVLLINNDAGSDYVYNGEAQTLRSVHYNDIKLIENTDYTITYNNNTNASTKTTKASYTIAGNGNYTGTYTGEFEIKKQTIDYGTLNWSTPSGSKTYNGEVQEYPSTITNVKDDKVAISYQTYSDYDCTNQKDFKDAGTYYLKVTLSIKDNYKGNYTFAYDKSSITEKYNGSFEIKPVEANITYSGTTQFEYTGEHIKLVDENFAITTNITSEQTLTRGTDYTITYSTDENYTDAGVYSATITLSNTNYYIGTNGASIYRETTWGYTITAKALLEKDLKFNYPRITHYVWANYEIKEGNNGTITYNEKVVGNFYLDRPADYNGTVKTVLKKNMTDTNYTCEFTEVSLDAEALSGKISYENIYFNSFKINGTLLTAEQIQNLASFVIGDKVEIEMNSGYTITQSSTVGETGAQTLAFTAGTEQKDGAYVFPYSEMLYVYQNGKMDSLTGRSITINRDMFTSFSVGSINMLIGADYYNLKNTNTTTVGDVFNIECKTGFEVSIEEIKNSTTTTVVKKSSSTTYTTPSTDAADTIVVKIYKEGSNEAFLTFNYTVITN